MEVDKRPFIHNLLVSELHNLDKGLGGPYVDTYQPLLTVIMGEMARVDCRIGPK